MDVALNSWVGKPITGSGRANARYEGHTRVIQTGGKSEAELTSFQAYAAGKRRLLPDADLIERVLAGDRISFDVLVVRHSPLVLGFLSSRLSNVTAAEDLAQEVFLSAYSHLQALRDRSRFVPWLVRIARNRLLDYRRGISRRRETTLPENDTGIPIEEVRDPSPGPADTASNSQVQLAVLEEIARMKERYRAVLFPRLVGEESTEEIARRLGLKVDTTRMRLLRGMRKLRKALTRRGITLEGAAP